MVISETCECILNDEKRILLDDLMRGIFNREAWINDIKKDKDLVKEQKEALIELTNEQIKERRRLIDEIEKIKSCEGY